VTPARLGVAVGVGVFIACTPFLGGHLLIALVASRLLRLNTIAVAAGTQFSLPPLIPVIAWASVQVGASVRPDATLPTTIAQLRALPPATLVTHVGEAWLVGCVVVGGACALVVGAVVAAVAHRRALATVAS
jgi:uncharacterized protein (DUF2062 family)